MARLKRELSEVQILQFKAQHGLARLHRRDQANLGIANGAPGDEPLRALAARAIRGLKEGLLAIQRREPRWSPAGCRPSWRLRVDGSRRRRSRYDA